MAGRLALIVLRLRYGVLALLAAGGIAALLNRPPSAHQAIMIAITVMAGTGIGWWQLRCWPLAALAAIAPLPGLLWFPAVLSAYGLMFAVGLLMANCLTDRLLRGGSDEAAFAAQFEIVPPILGAVLVALLWSPWGPRDVAAIIAALAATLLLLPSGASFLPFGEDFFMAANRARERRSGAAIAFARLAEARWTLSLSGILMVFGVLGVFAGPLPRNPGHDVGAFFAGLAVMVVTRDGRMALAAFLSSSVLLLLAHNPTMPLLVFVLVALVLARAASRFQQAAPWQNWARALEDNGSAILCAGLGAAAASLARGPFAGADMILALGGGLIFFPALTLLLENAVPRRRSVEDLYRA